jgi:hypothetical protein
VTAPGGEPAWAEIVFADQAYTASLTRAVRRGTLVRLARGIYTTAADEDLAAVTHRNLWRLAAHELPGAVIADRSAPAGGLPVDGKLYLVHSRRRPVEFPGVTIIPRPGTGPVDSDMPLPDGLWMSSTARALLDNLDVAHADTERYLSRAELEAWIERLLQQRGEEGLNVIRDCAKRIAVLLRRSAELRELDAIIGAALATRSASVLVSPELIARAAKRAYDQRRIEAFGKLAGTLRDLAPDTVVAFPAVAGRREQRPFYEA